MFIFQREFALDFDSVSNDSVSKSSLLVCLQPALVRVLALPLNPRYFLKVNNGIHAGKSSGNSQSSRTAFVTPSSPTPGSSSHLLSPPLDVGGLRTPLSSLYTCLLTPPFGDSNFTWAKMVISSPTSLLLLDFPSSKRTSSGTSLVVQWLRFHASNTGCPGSIPGWGIRSPRASTKFADCV